MLKLRAIYSLFSARSLDSALQVPAASAVTGAANLVVTGVSYTTSAILPTLFCAAPAWANRSGAGLPALLDTKA